jgi:aminopeptidase N
VASEAAPGGRRRERWVEQSPHAAYLFGFAAGELARAGDEAVGVELVFLGAGETPQSLSRKLAPTASMLRFFSEKAGLPLPRSTYAQVVVPGSEAQEKSSFSILGTRQLDPILENPREDWVIAHELAHQWWGNSITCRDWSHFWLNEGLTSFMVAAFKERRWGRAAYDREIALFEARRRQAREAGWDVPLAYAGEYPSLALKRAVVYAKGALFLHALREELGDEAFWSGLRAYTRQHAGGSVESRDLQLAFERATETDLHALFAAWVDPAPTPTE